MNRGVAENPSPRLQVVDLCGVEPAELDGLWRREVRWWRECLRWDVADAFATFRRVLERGGVRGKAVRVGAQTVGYAFYVIRGSLGVIAGFAVSPDWSVSRVGEILLQETVDDIRRQGVSRIESQFIAIDCPWLPAAFERAGFRTYWREFLRRELRCMRVAASPPALARLEPWQGTQLHEAAVIMQAAYADGVEAEMTRLYRTSEGCRAILENLLGQGSSGRHVAGASAMARHRGQGIGFITITEIAPRQGHLAQVAVLPEYQRRGVGRLLVSAGVSRLAELAFDTLSLIVSRANHRALRMYQAMGLRSVLAFPVFTWEDESTGDY